MKIYGSNILNEKVNLIFDELKMKINELLPHARVEHIGATSIPNTLTKGDLDILVAVAKNDHQKAVDQIKEMGFKEKLDTFRSDELCMLVTNNYEIDTSIQLIANGSEFEDFLRFRDILRENKNLVTEYNNLKLKAKDYPEDRYRSEKSAFIQKVLKNNLKDYSSN